MVSYEVKLPTEEELTFPEIQLSSPALRASAFHLGKYCQETFNVIKCSYFLFACSILNENRMAQQQL